MKILIAGGGIGGLTAALSCLHYGYDVQVFERAEALQNVGAGIQLSPNAMAVFRALGLQDILLSKAFKPKAIQARMGRSGRGVFTIPLKASDWGGPYLHIHRSDLMEILAEAVRAKASKAIIMGADVSAYETTTSGAALIMANGAVSGDVLIAADGIKSLLRAQMVGPDSPQFTGNVAWRAVVPAAALGGHAPDPTACVWMGPNRHAVSYHLGGGLVNFVGVVEQEDWVSESWTETGKRKDLQSDFAGWHPVITNIIQNCPPDKLYKWALFDRPPFSQWVDGRTALLGDAAHPMLPFMAQGAAMAIEDAWVLARSLHQSEDVPGALLDYQSQRQARTAKAQATSRANMGLYHKSNAVSQALTYGPMWLGGKIAPAVVRSRLDWLYGHDVTSQ